MCCLFVFFKWLSKPPLTGQAKLKGKTILDLSFLTGLLKENVFPPRTGVDPIPKLQGPAAETLDWYSFRQTLKNVSHSLRAHFRSAALRAPSQHMPLGNSPFALCIDKICSSNCPDPCDTCWETQEWLFSVQTRTSPGSTAACRASTQNTAVHPLSRTEWPFPLLPDQQIHIPPQESRAGRRQQPRSCVSKSCLLFATRLY